MHKSYGRAAIIRIYAIQPNLDEMCAGVSTALELQRRLGPGVQVTNDLTPWSRPSPPGLAEKFKY